MTVQYVTLAHALVDGSHLKQKPIRKIKMAPRSNACHLDPVIQSVNFSPILVGSRIQNCLIFSNPNDATYAVTNISGTEGIGGVLTRQM